MGGVALLLAVELRHQVIEVRLRVGVLHLDLGRLFGELVFDGEQQMGLAQPRFAIDEQGCACAAFVRERGKLEGRAIGMAVFWAVDKVFEGEFRVGRERRAIGVLLDRCRSCGDARGRCGGWFCTLCRRPPFIWFIMRRKSSAESVFLIAMPESSTGVASCAIGMCGSGHRNCCRWCGGHGFTGNIADLMLGSRHCGGSWRRRGRRVPQARRYRPRSPAVPRC